MKYAMAYSFYIGCPNCEGLGSPDLVIFQNIHDLINWLAEHVYDSEVANIKSIDENITLTVYTNTTQHAVSNKEVKVFISKTISPVFTFILDASPYDNKIIMPRIGSDWITMEELHKEMKIILQERG